MLGIQVKAVHMISLLLTMFSIGNARIRAVNQVADPAPATPAPDKTGATNDIPGTTFRFCKLAADKTKPDDVTHAYGNSVEASNIVPANASGYINYTTAVSFSDPSEWMGYYGPNPPHKGVEFYMRITDSTGQDPYLYRMMTTYKSALQIPDYTGIHQVALHLNNASVKQMENAVTSAWSKRYDGSTLAANPMQIVFIDNGTAIVSAQGLPLMKVIYIQPVHSAVGSIHKRIYANNISFNEIPRTEPPSVQDLREELKKIDITLHDDVVFEGYASFATFVKQTNQSTTTDTAAMKSELLEIAREQKAKQGCDDTGDDDLDLRFGNIGPWIVTSRANGSFSYSTVSIVPSVVMVNNTLYLGYLPSLANHPKYGQHYFQPTDVTFGNGSITWPIDIQYSFRMYANLAGSTLNIPINIQLLPLLEERMTKRLQDSLHDDKVRATVTIWNPEFDGNAINFFVTFSQGENFVYADPALSYSQTVYDKLQDVTLEIPVPSVGANMSYVLKQYPYGRPPEDNDKQSIIEACKKSGSPFELCPVNETFTLYVESTTPKLPTFPTYEPKVAVADTVNASRVLRAVEQAFFQANPVTVDDVTLTIALTAREDLRTVEGNDAVKLTFAASYPEMDTHKYWNLWRYPAVDALNSFLNETAAVRLTTSWTLKV